MHDLNCASPRLLLETLINWRNNPHFTPSQVRVNMFHRRTGEMAFYKVGISSKEWNYRIERLKIIISYTPPPPLKKIVGSPLMTIHLKQWFIHTLYFCYTRCIYNIWWEWPPLGPSAQILSTNTYRVKAQQRWGHSIPYPILYASSWYSSCSLLRNSDPYTCVYCNFGQCILLISHL